MLQQAKEEGGKDCTLHLAAAQEVLVNLGLSYAPETELKDRKILKIRRKKEAAAAPEHVRFESRQRVQRAMYRVHIPRGVDRSVIMITRLHDAPRPLSRRYMMLKTEKL